MIRTNIRIANFLNDSQGEVTDPEKYRWIFIEADNGGLTLAMNTSLKKEASKNEFYTKEFISTNIKKSDFGAITRKKLASEVKNFKNFPIEKIASEMTEQIAELAEHYGYREEEFSEETKEAFLTSFTGNPVRDIIKKVSSLLDYGVRNTTNIYKYIDENIISAGISPQLVAHVIGTKIHEGSLAKEDISILQFKKIAETEEVDSAQFNEGYAEGLKYSEISPKATGSWLVGYYTGAEEGYTFSEKG